MCIFLQFMAGQFKVMTYLRSLGRIAETNRHPGENGRASDRLCYSARHAASFPCCSLGNGFGWDFGQNFTGLLEQSR